MRNQASQLQHGANASSGKLVGMLPIAIAANVQPQTDDLHTR
jgi:hypothetical protein